MFESTNEDAAFFKEMKKRDGNTLYCMPFVMFSFLFCPYKVQFRFLTFFFLLFLINTRSCVPWERYFEETNACEHEGNKEKISARSLILWYHGYKHTHAHKYKKSETAFNFVWPWYSLTLFSSPFSSFPGDLTSFFSLDNKRKRKRALIPLGEQTDHVDSHRVPRGPMFHLLPLRRIHSFCAFGLLILTMHHAPCTMSMTCTIAPFPCLVLTSIESYHVSYTHSCLFRQVISRLLFFLSSLFQAHHSTTAVFLMALALKHVPLFPAVCSRECFSFIAMIYLDGCIGYGGHGGLLGRYVRHLD